MTRSVIVTGGFGVLGEAVAQAFSAAGDFVTRVDFSLRPRSTLSGVLDIGGIDLTDAVATQGALTQVIAVHGKIDVLVNVAGGFVWEPIASGKVGAWSKMHEMNVLTTVTMTQLALPMLIESPAGRIVNIGAGAAVKAGLGMGAYAASKSGVHRLTEALADELAATNVTVNAVLPSIIDTPTNRAEMPGADTSKWVHPQAIAKVILLLASVDAGAVNGALIPVSRAI